MMPCRLETERFLSLFGSPGASFTYQCVGEGEQEKNRALLRILHGPFQERMDELAALNNQGAGVFVTVNETDGQGRKAQNIASVWPV